MPYLCRHAYLLSINGYKSIYVRKERRQTISTYSTEWFENPLNGDKAEAITPSALKLQWVAREHAEGVGQG
jgi:hypothetical protein